MTDTVSFLGEVDLHLIGEGRHEQLWDVLGAHVRTTSGGVTGTSFAVWAPRAREVRVAGDFNNWSGQDQVMRRVGDSGVWELFVPNVGDGTRYKFLVHGADGSWKLRADPLAFRAETPPATASEVFTSAYIWDDTDWMTKRPSQDPAHDRPMSVYEVHLGSWRRGRSYRDLAEELTAYVSDRGFTHVELMPVAEHPYGGSWGYQVTSYFAPTSRFGSPDDFRSLIDRLHQAGIGVLMDWVPGHFPKDDWALALFDGSNLYEHPDPRRGEHPDWGTNVFDFGRPEVRNFLVANAIYCLEAISFLQEVNATAYKRVPGIVMVAEESTAWPGVTKPTHLGGLGFGLKWNMGWMNDSLAYMSHDSIHRQYHHHQMTFSLMYAYSENFLLPLSHDEVVHGKGSLLRKMPGDRWRQLANLRAYLALMWAHPGKQLLFMGGEIGQEAEWAESHELDWWLLDHPEHAGLQRLVTDLNAIYRETTALWTQDSDPAGFEWIDANDAAGNVFSFLRWGSDGSVLACLANFSALPHEGYRVGLPRAGKWTEIVNTDATGYGGSGVGNLGAVETEDAAWHGRPVSVTLRLPPLGTLWLRHEPSTVAENVTPVDAAS
jgi:1,4-alpha-glucan branching enzyme